MLANKRVKLNNGREMPLVGLGTWLIRGYDNMKTALSNAIELGYRHIDTAFKYKNEKEIGTVLKEFFAEGKIKREELFITTKVHQLYHNDPAEGLRRSLEALQLDYVDLYMIHWPVSFAFKPTKDYEMQSDFDEEDHELAQYDPVAIWKKMEALVKEGKVKSLGICNHGLKNTKLILNNCTIKPAVGQFEFHPYLQQPELVKFYKDNNIAIIAHSCLAGGFNPGNKPRLLEDPVVLELAKKYNMQPTQVILSYALQNDIGIIPKAIERKWQADNVDLKEMNDDDLKKLRKIDKNFRFSDHPSYGPYRFS